MNIVIRTDASIYIGTGHVMRCLVLAQVLRESGHNVNFSMREQPADLIDLVKSKGFFVHKLVNPVIWNKPAHNADYPSWLHVTEQEDAISFCNVNSNVEIVIVDHYSLNTGWEINVRASLNCKIFVIDDLLRSHSCDLLLDQTLGRKKDDYKELVPKSSKIIAGCEYALLNPYFAKARINKKYDSREKIVKHKVLITMGGIDSSNVTLPVLKEIVKYGLYNFSLVTVVINPKSPFYEYVIEYISNYEEFINQVDFVENMAELMLNHTIAIGAPGATSWERACLGLPSIIVPLAENQKMVCHQLTEYGVAIKIELSDLGTAFDKALNELLMNYDEYKANCLELCDGLGVFRTQTHINKLNGDNESCFSDCRLANMNDIQQVYHWQTLPETRRFSLNTRVPSLEEHTLWMKNKLTSNNDYFYIIEVNSDAGDNIPAGVIRLDKLDNSKFLVSIFIAPEYYGKAVAKSALGFIDMVHRDIVINATVLTANMASQKLFMKAGYTKLDDEHYQRSPIGNSK
ncbi:UDP-2,4-diacetamido-2,4,6-trideoxy-beta-L-altropyranose hydrolase [Colwelliaceae bacterium BS250]